MGVFLVRIQARARSKEKEMKAHDIELEFKGYIISIQEGNISRPYLRIAHDDWWLYEFDHYSEVSDLKHPELEKAFRAHLSLKTS